VSFWHLFVRILFQRPLSALEALFWYLTRRRVRANNRLRAAAADLPIAYELWISTVEKPRDAKALETAKDAKHAHALWFTAIIYGGDTRATELTVQSLTQQIYDKWGAIVLAPRPADVAYCSSRVRYQASLRQAIAKSTSDYIVMVEAGALLPPLALLRYAEAVQQNCRATVLYGDQDEMTADGDRQNPWFKPAWNREMFLAQDYLSGAAAIDRAAAREATRAIAGELDFANLLLRITASPGASIVHIPHVLSHLPPHGREIGSSARLHGVAAIVEAEGGKAVPGPFGTTKVEWPLPQELPLVSILVPTRDKVDLLRACITGVLERTDYPNLELIIVDNRSTDPRTISFLSKFERHPQVRVLAYPHEYNFSALNNFAAQQARGSLLCLLNNDTEVLEPQWLTEMVRYSVRPEIGAVGAKLLYPDGTVQHAGVAIGIGGAAGHSHRHLSGSEPGYFRQAHVAQYVSAVTAACLLVDKRKYQEVGGLDERDLQVAFNDVDFCLKLQARGYRNVYVPHAVLLHHESKSRGSDAAPRNIARYTRELHALQQRWQTESYNDPTHSPNLDRSSERFIVGL